MWAWWKKANYWECALERDICFNLLSFCLVESKLHLFVCVCLCAHASMPLDTYIWRSEDNLLRSWFSPSSVCHGFKLKIVRPGSKHPEALSHRISPNLSSLKVDYLRLCCHNEGKLTNLSV